MGFRILLEGATQTKYQNTLEACIEWIDKKTKQVFTRTPVIVIRDMFSGEMLGKEATATSYTDDAVWVSYTNTDRRERVGKSRVYSDTDENHELLNKILAESQLIKDANKRKYDLSRELEQFDVSVMTAGE
jgi:hypothetical protein